jgi:hypothetical protein
MRSDFRKAAALSAPAETEAESANTRKGEAFPDSVGTEFPNSEPTGPTDDRPSASGIPPSTGAAGPNERPHLDPTELETLRARVVELEDALNGMIEAYWRGSEVRSDARAPTCVKAALKALKPAALRAKGV